MRQWLIVFVGVLTLIGCGEVERPASVTASSITSPANLAVITDETARLNQWFDLRYEEELDFSPIRKTYLGRKDDYDRIDDMSEAAEDEVLAWRRQTVADLQASFDYDKLTPEAQTSWNVWLYQLELEERALPVRRRGYVFTQMMGPQVFLPQFLINLHKVDEPADMQAYIQRIGGISTAIRQLLERAQLAAAEDARPPRFAYEGVLEQARGLASGRPFDGPGEQPLWADGQAKLAALQKAGKIDQSQAAELAAAVERALIEQFKPAYDALISWLEADIAKTDEAAAGVWKLPDGEAVYAVRLREATTTNITPDEVHEYGLAEVARIHEEMTTIKDRVGYEGTLQEFFVFMREDPRFFFPDTDEGREAYLEAARGHLDFITEQLPDFFGILPKAALEVKRVEPFREQPGAAQHYQSGTPDGSRPGVYYAHLSDMNAMPKHQLEVVAYHEGNPGHHMQISIAQELTSVPTFRTQAGFTAYSEGWALYAELLALEMGAYEDPYSDFGRLSTELWRAIRLVLDTGIHTRRWTEEQAVAYFVANSPSAEGAIRSEVQRYFAWPGQATAYKIGMRTILELREAARLELGERFDIRGFHDTVLGGGALPLSVLERRVGEWVAGQ
jgi:uncharacterized protein (DUF885 family)